MNCCGVTTFLVFSLIALSFLSSFFMGLGHRTSQVSYKDNYKMQHVNFPFNNDAFQAKMRFNLDKNQTLDNMKNDFGEVYTNKDLEQFICSHLKVSFWNYYYNEKDEYTKQSLDLACIRDSSYELYETMLYAEDTIISVLLQVEEGKEKNNIQFENHSKLNLGFNMFSIDLNAGVEPNKKAL